jgi:ElaA protein
MYQWTLKSFDELSVRELYEILRLRSEVFVVEQNCVFLDMDGKDPYCHHLMGWATAPEALVSPAGAASGKPTLAAYARIVPSGVSYAEPSIGRVVSSPGFRGKRAGRTLMEQAVEQVHALYGSGPIRIGAQQYLEGFYGSFGFAQEGEMYMEDGIPHIIMVKKQV